MSKRYTDIDLMILNRWEEVKSLRDAFDDLLLRIGNVVEGSMEKVATTVSERGLSADFERKPVSIWFWKREWENRKKEPGIYLQITDFLPSECGRNVGDHPSMRCMIDEFYNLRIRESSEDFGRAVRAALPPDLLAKWTHHESEISRSPLQKECDDVSESDRVRMVADSELLSKFLLERVDEFAGLIPAIDQALQTMTRR